MCPPPDDNLFLLSLRVANVVELDTTWLAAGCANALAIPLLAASVRRPVTATALRRLYGAATGVAVIASLPFVVSAAVQLAHVFLNLTGNDWALTAFNWDTGVGFTATLALLVVAALVALPAASTAWVARRHQARLTAGTPLDLQSVLLATLVGASPWGCLASLRLDDSGLEVLRQAWRGETLSGWQREVLATQLLFIALTVAASILPLAARAGARRSGPPAGTPNEFARFRALTNAPSHASLRPASHP